MKNPTPSLFLAFATSVVVVHAQGTVQITFDGPPIQPPGSAYSITSYSESGMLFKPGNGSSSFGRVAPGYPADPQNGTTHLTAAFTESLSFAMANDSLLGLVSVDLAEYSTLYQSPLTVQFTGFHHDGSIVTADFTTDGIIDGTGPLADFETFYFGPEFSNLIRVEIPRASSPDGSWSLDNLVVRPVPEPAPLALGLTGGLLLWFMKRCRGRRNSVRGGKRKKALLWNPVAERSDDSALGT